MCKGVKHLRNYFIIKVINDSSSNSLLGISKYNVLHKCKLIFNLSLSS